MTTIDDAKRRATLLRRDLAERGADLPHSAALELIAHQLGHRDWNTASAALQRSPSVGAGVPVLRVQDGEAASAFYGLLGFAVDWRHRFEEGLPLYLQVRRDDCVLHLSEHFGDGTPGSVVWIPVHDVAALHAAVLPRLRDRQRPGLDRDAPGGPTFTVLDPWGNTLRFCGREE